MRYGKIPAGRGRGGGEVRWRNESHTSAHPFLCFLKFAEEGEVTENNPFSYETASGVCRCFVFFKNQSIDFLLKPHNDKI